MDVKVSRKETRWQPDGPVEVLIDNIWLIATYGGKGRNMPEWRDERAI
jgi:hypothetical protein